ncbi:hypothetical protein JXA84_00535 [candidate division WOR-3 bacterium]|nr:hypothetical protein [candidate division WOR-3 bacterium]
MKHLDEISIQTFLENGGKDLPIKEHLDQCEECRRLVKEYELLFQSLLLTDKKDKLPLEFTQKCILAIESKKAFSRRIRIFFYSLSALLVLALSSLYALLFLNYTTFFKPFCQFFSRFPQNFSFVGNIRSGSFSSIVFLILLTVLFSDIFLRGRIWKLR